MIGVEAWLLAGIVAFHACDSALLLYGDDVVFSWGRRGWRAGLGSGFMLAGRYLALPALFAPGTPVFRARWNGPSEAEAAPAREQVLAVLRPLRWVACFVAGALFLLVPLGLLVHAHPVLMLALLMAIYASSVASMAYVWRRRALLGLSSRAVASIAVDVIACPPFALHLVQRISLRMPLPVAPQVFAAQVLDAASLEALRNELRKRMALADGALSDTNTGGGSP